MSDARRQARAALNVDADPPPVTLFSLDLAAILEAQSARYQRLVKQALAHPHTDWHDALVRRLTFARALEVAAFMTALYGRLALDDDRAFWDGRRRYCEAKTYVKQNPIASSIGAGPEEDDAARLGDRAFDLLRPPGDPPV